MAAAGPAAFRVLTPSGQNREWAGHNGAAAMTLTEAGFYEFRPASGAEGDPLIAAVNVPPVPRRQ